MSGRKRLPLILTLVLIVAMLATACVAPVTPTAQTTDEAKGKILHVLSKSSPESQAFYRQAAADFEKAHPGVAVSLDFPTGPDTLAIRVAAGEPPDIATMQLENTNCPTLTKVCWSQLPGGSTSMATMSSTWLRFPTKICIMQSRML